MAVKLDDFLAKKKEPAQVLDLSRVKITSKDELRKYLDKIPEYKIKPEKIAPESIKIRDKDFSFIPGRRETRKDRRGGENWNYLDPVPPDMKGVQLEDLCPVTIEWKMLTTLRPKTRIEEEMFSRLVQLGKLDLKHQQSLKRSKDTDWIRRTKNPKSSIVETRVLSCRECGEDFCDGSTCSLMTYEGCFRIQKSALAGIVKNEGGLDGGDDEKVVKKKKKRRKGRSTKRKLRKNSIFNRPPSQGCNRDHNKRLKNSEKRSQSHDRTRSRSLDLEKKQRAPRAKSAPRVLFNREDEKGEDKRSVTWIAGFTSDCISGTESESPLRHVPPVPRRNRKKCMKRKIPRRRPSLNWHLRLGSGSDSAEDSLNRKICRPCRHYSSDESEDEDEDFTEEHQPLHTTPATIQLNFQPPDNHIVPQQSRLNSRFQFKSPAYLRKRQLLQDEEYVTANFSRIDLKFEGLLVKDGTPTSRIRNVKTHKSCKSTSSSLDVSSESILKGKGLLQRQSVTTEFLE